MTRKPVGGPDQDVGGVLDRAVRPGQPPQFIDDERGKVDDPAVVEHLPPHDADSAPGTDALLSQDLRQRERSVAGLAGKTEVLEEVAPHGEGSGIRHSPALVAHEDGRHLIRAHDEEGLFETRIEAGQVGEIGTVLAIGVHDDSVEPPLG